MTRILLDQGLAPKAAVNLRRFGFDAIRVSGVRIVMTKFELLAAALASPKLRQENTLHN